MVPVFWFLTFQMMGSPHQSSTCHQPRPPTPIANEQRVCAGHGYNPGGRLLWSTSFEGNHDRLLINSTGQKAAIHSKNLARHEACRVGGKKNRRPGQLFDFTEPLHGCAQQKLTPTFRLVK